MKKDWEIKKLGEVCETGSGGTPLKANKDYYEGGAIPWLMSGEVSQGEIFEAKNFITEKGLKNSSAKLFPVNTVLVAMYGATAGQTGILKFEATTNQAVCGILPNCRFIPEFLYYCFLLKKDELISLAVGNAQPNISQIKIRNTIIPVPPLPEQKRIVAKLDQAFSAIERSRNNAEQNLKNAKELFENSLNNIFEGNEDWVQSTLGKYATFRNGMNYSKNGKGESIKIVGVRNFQKNYWVPFQELEEINLDNELKEFDELKQNDIIAVRSNGNPELIGRTLLAGEFEGKVSHSGFTIRIRLQSDKILPKFACHFLKSIKARKSLVDSGIGVGIKSLNQGSLSGLSITFPKTIDEQKRIVEKIEKIAFESQNLQTLYQKKLADLEELKKSILQKAFNGELTEKIVEL
ncbi:restriction endonuclease subunit S [Draconibacterium sp.]